MEGNNVSICVSSLKKRYKDREVLRDVTFSVPTGTIYALLGSNGAGKATTVRILTTQLCPDGGAARIRGFDVIREPEKVHQVISVTGQFSALDESLTGMENLLLMGRLRHLADPEKSAVRLLASFSLSPDAHRRVSGWSGGMKRKLDIAMSLVGSPDVLFLDEPTTGLDPQSRLAMWQIVRRLRDGGMTVLLTTQYLEEAEQLADQIGILSEGKILAEGDPRPAEVPSSPGRRAVCLPQPGGSGAGRLSSGSPCGKMADQLPAGGVRSDCVYRREGRHPGGALLLSPGWLCFCPGILRGVPLPGGCVLNYDQGGKIIWKQQNKAIATPSPSPGAACSCPAGTRRPFSPASCCPPS